MGMDIVGNSWALERGRQSGSGRFFPEATFFQMTFHAEVEDLML